MIARAHQLAMEGYQWHFNDNQLVTVWSAPNYMYRSGNKASIMNVSSDLQCTFKVFEAVPDRQYFPKYVLCPLSLFPIHDSGALYLQHKIYLRFSGIVFP